MIVHRIFSDSNMWLWGRCRKSEFEFPVYTWGFRGSHNGLSPRSREVWLPVPILFSARSPDSVRSPDGWSMTRRRWSPTLSGAWRALLPPSGTDEPTSSRSVCPLATTGVGTSKWSSSSSRMPPWLMSAGTQGLVFPPPVVFCIRFVFVFVYFPQREKARMRLVGLLPLLYSYFFFIC